MKAPAAVLSVLGYLGMLAALVLFSMASWDLIIQPAQAGEQVGFPEDLSRFVVAFFVFAGGILIFAAGRGLSAIADSHPRVRIEHRRDGFYLVSKNSEDGPFMTTEVAQLALEKPILTDTLKQLR